MHEYEVFLWKLHNQLQDTIVSTATKEDIQKRIHETLVSIRKEIRPELPTVADLVEAFDESA